MKAAEESSSGKGILAPESSISVYGDTKDAATHQPTVEKAIGIPLACLVGEEDREHLATFSSWGTPASRDTPGWFLDSLSAIRSTVISTDRASIQPLKFVGSFCAIFLPILEHHQRSSL